MSDEKNSPLFRYRRQILFADWGENGQKQLERSSAFICGVGALGSSIANLLVRAGIGRLGFVDPDIVQLDNLHRQTLFSEWDAEHSVFKAQTVKKCLQQINKNVLLDSWTERLTPENADAFFSHQWDVLIDGTDNFRTRLLLNEISVRQNIPFVTGGVLGASGQIISFFPKKTPCLACLLGISAVKNKKTGFFDYPNDCEELDRSGMDRVGILAPIVQLIAALQTTEVLKILLGHPEAAFLGIQKADLWRNSFLQIPFGSESVFEPAERLEQSGSLDSGFDVLKSKPTVSASRNSDTENCCAQNNHWIQNQNKDGEIEPKTSSQVCPTCSICPVCGRHL